MLSRSGYVVALASDGVEALERCRTEIPDLVLTDIAMPRLDGLAFIEAARREFPSVPIVAMSGGLVESPDFLRAAKRAGAVGTLAKPFSLHVLLDMVAASLVPNAAEAPESFGMSSATAQPFAIA